MGLTGKLNNCDTCDQLKNSDDLDSAASSSYYSSDCDESSSTSRSRHTDLRSLRLNLGCKNDSRQQNQSADTQNKTFSSDKIREIERRNAMLVDRILYHSKRPNQYKSNVARFPKVTSSEINRRRYQEKISRENEILLKKIQSVKPAVKRS